MRFKNFPFVFLISLILLSTVSLKAQQSYHWEHNIPDSSQDNFFDVVDAFNEYWKDKDHTEKGKGWKQFKRWEWFWGPRVDENGNFPDPMHLYYESLKHRKQNTKSKSNKLQSSQWSQIGPSTSPGGYAGMGRLNCVRVTPNSWGNDIWVGSASGGLWHSTNGGSSWTTNTDNLPSLGVTDIVFHPSNNDIMYIATGDVDARDTYSVGVLKSTDGGQSWNTTGLNWQTSNVRTIGRLLIHPTNGNILIAATTAGIYRTTNAGTNWDMVQSGSFKDMEYRPDNPDVVYASGTTVYRSINGGQTWSQSASGISTSGILRIAIAVTEDNDQVIYAVAANNIDNGMEGIYKSTNGGDSWTKLTNSSSPNVLGWEFYGSDDGGQGSYDLAIEVNPFDEDECYIGGVNVWKTVNGGNTWSCIAMWTGHPSWNPGGVDVIHADHHMLHYEPGTEELYSCNDGGLYLTTNGGVSWSWLGSGLKITQFYKFGNSQTDQGLIITGSQDNGSKLKSGGSWYDVAGGDGMECWIDPNNDDVIYCSLYFGEIRKSVNGGGSFTIITDGVNDNGAWVTPYLINPDNSNELFAVYNNVWKTTNGGGSWSIQSGFGNSSNVKGVYIKMAPTDNDIMYVGVGTSHRFGSSCKLYQTTNGGQNWTLKTVPSSNYVTDLAVSSTDPDEIWMTVSGFYDGNKVFHSTNAGLTWENITLNLPNVPTNCIIHQDNADDRLFVGTDIGVWYKDNTMFQWEEYNDGLPNVVITELEILSNANKIRAATYGRSVWEAGLPASAPTPTLNTPADDTQDLAISNLELSWNTLSGVSNWDLQVSENSDMSSPFVDVSSQSARTYTLNNLDYSTTYYWKVRGSSGTSGWSSTWSFSTKLAAPVLSSPADQSVGNMLSGTLTWNAVSGAATYNLQIATADDFNAGSLVVDETGINTMSYNYSALAAETTHYWRVFAVNSNSTSAASDTWEFKTTIPAPVLTSPDNAAQGIPASGAVSWEAVTNADTYDLEIAENTTFSPAVIQQNDIDGTEFSYTNLDNYKTYYWKVKATNSEGDSHWSLVRSFKTLIAPPILNSPSYDAFGAALNGQFQWNTVEGAENYRLMVSKNLDFSSLVMDENNITGTSFDYVDFDLSTSYFWKVIANSTTDGVNQSMVWEFRTIPAVPSVISPGNGDVDVPVSGVIVWNKIPGNNTYDIQISTNSDFSALEVDSSDIIDSSFSFVDLTKETTYHIRVRTVDEGNITSDWYSSSFTTAGDIAGPQLKSPTNGATGIELNTTLEWHEVAEATAYNIQAAKSNDFEFPFVDDNSTGLSYAVNDLEEKTKYYWRVRATVDGEITPWSSVWNFTTKTYSEAPSLISPADNAQNVPVSGTMEWSEVAEATTYSLQVSLVNTFATKVIDQSELTQTNYDYSGLENSATYYWRVRAHFAGIAETEWSSVGTFSTESGGIAAPVLTAPLNNADNIPVEGRLSWQAVTDADKYTLQMSDDNNFANIIIESENLSTTHYDYSGLLQGTKYWWRVKAHSSDEESAWSSAWNFVTVSQIEAPEPVHPTDGATDIPQDGTLSWRLVQNADYYSLQISDNPTFRANKNDDNELQKVVVDESNIQDTVYSYSGLMPSTTYYWRISVTADKETSSWSNALSFTTDNVIGVEERNTHILSLTSYPNPFNESTFIEFAIDRASDIQLEIYNPLGVKIATIINGYYEPGKYSAEWNSDNNASGIYIAKLKVGNHSKTLKLILRK